LCEELPDAVAIECDLRDRAEVDAAFDRIRALKRPLDIVVHAAGVIESAPMMMQREEGMRALFDVNLFGAYYLLQKCVRPMMRTQEGSIVLLSSIMGLEGERGHTAYSASKGAVAALAKAMAKELAPWKIRVNAVAPGVVETSMIAGLDEKERKTYADKILLGRFARPEEVARAILFLASPMGSFVNAEVLRVDGGMHL
jgi:3-oxoacyl-[acyl-carrier protein] reductase